MNKTEKIVCILLGCVLGWYLFTQNSRPQEAAQGEAVPVQPQAAAPVRPQTAPVAGAPVPTEEAESVRHGAAEELVALENDELRLTLSTWGGVVKSATLKRYAQKEGNVGEDNPPVEFDFSQAPLGELRGGGIGAGADYRVESAQSNRVVFVSDAGSRTVTLGDSYLVTYEDSVSAPGAGEGATISLGVMSMGSSKNDLLSVDSCALGPQGEAVVHHGDDDSPLKAYLAGGAAGGCSGAKSAAGMPKAAKVEYPGPQKWVAVKNRFFVTALVSSSAPVGGFAATIERDTASDAYRPESVSVRAAIDAAGAGGKVTSVFYVGPKKQSLLWDLGMKDAMEFGIWRWVCYPILWILNACNAVIPNYGVAIILLTILVRLVFWPLTHKSTVGMKKMQEIQPLMKELQAKYKDNPQRLQQETFALYREHKVNPLSSCLPMLIQIPVFIALFNVLRSAVELRYAPFLWIADLSQPEGLGATSWFPFFGGLNILPILMAVTMGLQSALTPTAGDKTQQKMMMVFMPVMMLVMFYSFPSALSLYWTLSQVVSIIQMWVIRRQTQARQKPAMEIVDPPQTRQMRRHGGEN